MSDDLRLRPATSGDWPAIAQLLRDNSLPLDGVPDHLAGFVVAEVAQGLAGVAGLEVYGQAALLRSLAVVAARRDGGIGGRLVTHLEEQARSASLESLYLLTLTAEPFFLRRGYERLSRSSIPDALHASAELRGACPASAVVMAKRL